MNKSAFNPAVVIPVYNHEKAISLTLKNVMKYKLPVLLVDDGSDERCAKVLCDLAKQYNIDLLRLPLNGGKGFAVKSGLQNLVEKGYSHALQIDADGQHNLDDIPTFLSLGENNSSTLITGCPQYDESISKGRLYGRYLTHIWVWINTLSFVIKDSMCGFRLYPLHEATTLLKEEPCGNRMDFDPEIIVRWVWRGGDILNVKTKVHYPSDGVSHFKLWHDNTLISWMHTRLFFGMLKRLPQLLKRKF